MSSQRSLNVAGVVVAVILISGGVILLSFSQLGFNPGNETTTTTTTMEPDDGFVRIDELVAATYDGTGFANEPGLTSTMLSTLHAVELLSEFDSIEGSITLEMLESINSEILQREDPNGGFQKVPGSFEASLETTALSLRTLNLMDCSNQEIYSGVISYLADTFRGGLSYDHWISEGVLEEKYWGLRCAYEINSLVQIGIKPITLDNIFEEGEEPGIGTEPVLWIGQTYYGTQLDTKTFDTKLTIFECFEYMIPNPLHRPTIIGLLVDETNTVNQLVAMFNETSGLVNNDLELTLTTFRILTNTGNITRIFDNENVTSRINRIQERIESVVDIDNARANPNGTISEIFFLTKIARIIAFNQNHGFIEPPGWIVNGLSSIMIVVALNNYRNNEHNN